jgi:hypothetical protein
MFNGVPAPYASLSDHAITAADPVLAGTVQVFVQGHIVPGTQYRYNSATKQYVHFCSVRGVSPWPPDPVWVTAWIVRSTMTVSVPSMKVYLSALRSAVIDRGLVWTLQGNPLISRAMRSAKRRYGMPGSALKVPISLRTLRLMCSLLPGWPCPGVMLHDDILWVAASCIAVVGFLRGGEFLFSPRSSRPVLRACDVRTEVCGGTRAVCVRILQPKARWWLSDCEVVCFDMGPACPLNPSDWLGQYRRVHGRPLPPEGPAFVLKDGSKLSKAWMLSRTAGLLEEAGVSLLDPGGSTVKIKMSSWRAGGVESAKEAGISDSTIRALGRWSSSAWMNYCFTSRSDLKRAVSSLWAASNAGPASLVVGSFSAAGLFTDDYDR